MHLKSTLRATALAFYPRSNTTTPTNTTFHSGPPTPYITAVEPYQAHPVTYVQIGPYEQVPLYIYHQVRGIYIGPRFHPQQEQYFYSHVPPPPPQPVSPVGNEWWPGEEQGAWAGDEQGGMMGEYGGFGNGYGGYGDRKFKGGNQGGGKKWYAGKKKGAGKSKKKGERNTDDQATLTGRDNGIL